MRERERRTRLLDFSLATTTTHTQEKEENIMKKKKKKKASRSSWNVGTDTA